VSEIFPNRSRALNSFVGKVVVASMMLIPHHLQAWEFTPGLPCLLTHEENGVAFVLTYDPGTPLYTITVTHPDRWTEAPAFAMRFDGQMPIAIGTDRHEIDASGRSVSVTDSGFGNVLNGLQFNTTATATLGAQSVSVSLNGAEEQVAAFRACKVEAGA
jgi:hypothetical protein